MRIDNCVIGGWKTCFADVALWSMVQMKIQKNDEIQRPNLETKGWS